MVEKLRPAPPEIVAKLNHAREQFRQHALSDPTPQALGRGWDLYAIIAGLEDEIEGVVHADSTKSFRPTLPDLIELRKRFQGQNHDLFATRVAEDIFRLRVNGTQIGIGVQSMLAGLTWEERIKAKEFCWDMLHTRKSE